MAKDPYQRALRLEDCLVCGACCCNTAENEAEGYTFYVSIDNPKSRLLNKPDLRKRYVVEDEDGVPHLRLDPTGRCTAHTGKVGSAVRCLVYADRPGGCHRVDPGSKECERARAEKGVTARTFP
jgi:Fe-S-cluster containining protein